MNENVLLVLSDQNISRLSKLIDDLVDWKEKLGGWKGMALEWGDGPITAQGLKLSNKLVSEYIPDYYKADIQAVIDDVTDGDQDYRVAVDKLEDILQRIIDDLTAKLPEGKIPEWVIKSVHSLITGIEAFILMLLEKRIAESESVKTEDASEDDDTADE